MKKMHWNILDFWKLASLHNISVKFYGFSLENEKNQLFKQIFVHT